MSWSLFVSVERRRRSRPRCSHPKQAATKRDETDIPCADEFQARSPDELSLARGDRVELIERDDDFGDGWFLGRNTETGDSGLFPEGMFAMHRYRHREPLAAPVPWLHLSWPQRC
jgi:hypothetical protein